MIGCVGALLGFKLTQHIRAVFWMERTFLGSMHDLGFEKRLAGQFGGDAGMVRWIRSMSSLSFHDE